jgi:hypothetical protein
VPTRELFLDRFAYTPYGTFGRLTTSDGLLWWTVERPWADNRRNESCIPLGFYRMVRTIFHRGTADPDDDYDAYEILDVPDRSRILVHVGNTMDDVQGCIAVGSALGYVNGKWAVTNSRLAFGNFMEKMNGDAAILRVDNKLPDIYRVVNDWEGWTPNRDL